jgi:phosphoribosylformylglycinamidine (FGAM) synthase-like amidotransferase family enzyme
LTRNERMRFECRDVYVRQRDRGPFTKQPGRVLRLPIAHAEGRYQASDDVLAKLERDGNIALEYCDADGKVSEASNPNGSLRNIAGIYGGPKKNVFGLMPHPERMAEPLVGGSDGKALFDAICLA